MQRPPHSTEISKRVTFEDDKIIIKRTHDASHMLRDAQQAREVTENSFGSDYKLAGVVDMALVGTWLEECGVSWSDTEAVKDVLKRKLMSNEFSALRVWDGAF